MKYISQQPVLEGQCFLSRSHLLPRCIEIQPNELIEGQCPTLTNSNEYHYIQRQRERERGSIEPKDCQGFDCLSVLVATTKLLSQFFDLNAFVVREPSLKLTVRKERLSFSNHQFSGGSFQFQGVYLLLFSFIGKPRVPIFLATIALACPIKISLILASCQQKNPTKMANRLLGIKLLEKERLMTTCNSCQLIRDL